MRPNCDPYMNPHMRDATTAGTAYGRKIDSRYSGAQRSRALSSARAASSASTSMTGTCTARNSAALRSAAQNCGSLSASR